MQKTERSADFRTCQQSQGGGDGGLAGHPPIAPLPPSAMLAIVVWYRTYVVFFSRVREAPGARKGLLRLRL